MSRTLFSVLLGIILIDTLHKPASAQAAGQAPANIILILSDDVGAETLGAYGGESYQTPHLDQLARDGIRFEYGHSQPLCTPSRVKIMTGQYNFRNYHNFAFLDPSEMTFAHLLKQAGYSTAVVGKWQLLHNRFTNVRGATPSQAGFDEYLLWQLDAPKPGSRYWAPLLDHNGELRQHGADVFGPDVFNDYVQDYIEAHKAGPFFIYYPMVLAHDPWVTTPDMRDDAASDQDKFAAMMAYMDKLVGKVRRKVEEQGLAERTLIFFIGDNGTGREIVSRHQGFDVRGAKGKTINAGSRVPFLAWGPGTVKAGLVSDSLVNLNDILPTLAQVAGIDLPPDYPGDGTSLVPVMSGEGELRRESIFIHYEPRWPTALPARYVFDRRWKLYESGDFFDMRADPREQSPLNIFELEPEAADAYKALRTRLDNMPGKLSSNRRWLPPVAYKLLAATALAFLVLGWIAVRLYHKSRR